MTAAAEKVMKTVTAGKTAELRGYLWHCLAVFRPGSAVPVFQQPKRFWGNLAGISETEASLIVEEGRRQFDRQSGTLEHLRTNAGILLTLGLAEVALLADGAQASFSRNCLVAGLWILSAIFVLFGVLGVLGVLTAQAAFGHIDTLTLAATTGNRLRELACLYADRCQVGDCTVAARVTVIRDATWSLAVGGLLYAVSWPFQG